jgi:hypothetical protein
VAGEAETKTPLPAELDRWPTGKEWERSGRLPSRRTYGCSGPGRRPVGRPSASRGRRGPRGSGRRVARRPPSQSCRLDTTLAGAHLGRHITPRVHQSPSGGRLWMVRAHSCSSSAAASLPMACSSPGSPRSLRRRRTIMTSGSRSSSDAAQRRGRGPGRAARASGLGDGEDLAAALAADDLRPLQHDRRPQVSRSVPAS